MRRTMLCIGMALLALLSGCTMTGAPDGGQEAPTPGTTEPSPKAAETQPETESAAPPPQAEESGIPALFPDAGESDVLAVVGNPESAEFLALFDEATMLAAPLSEGRLEGAVLLVPLRDGVRIVVEPIEYDFNLNWFFPADEPLLDCVASAGEAYAIQDMLTVNMPDLRVTVEYQGLTALLYNQFGGEGEFVSFLSASVPAAQPIDEHSNMLPLSVAAASYACQLGDPAASWLPGDLAADGIGFWQIMAHAMTLRPPLINRDIDPYSGELIPVPEWMVACYAAALYPGVADWPPVPEMVKADALSGLYRFEPLAYGDYLSHEYLSARENPDGSHSVFLSVFCGELHPAPEVCVVTWEENPVYSRGTPFEYRLVRVEFLSVTE